MLPNTYLPDSTPCLISFSYTSQFHTMLKNLLTFLFLLLAISVATAQAANDDCASPVAITIGEVVDFSTNGATTDGPNHPGCFGANDSIPADIWFTFVATETQALRWTNCSTADYDSRMAVYATADACSASDDNLVTCNDDGPDCDLFTSIASFLAEAGQTYVLRMGGFGDDQGGVSTGAGTVILEVIDGPANGFCFSAIDIGLVTGQAFSTVDAITDGPNHPGNNACFGFGSITVNADIWYNFTPDFTGFVEWSTCGTADFDTRLAVYEPGSACPPLDEDLYACNDDGPGCSAFSSSLIFGVVAGQTYKLRLGGFGSESGEGLFNLTMVTPPAPPENDLCENAIPVGLLTREVADDFDEFVQGTTISGTFEPEGYQFPVCLNNQAGGEFADVWYSFETMGNDSIEIRLFPAGQGDNAAEFFFLDIFESCDNRVDTSMISGSCLFTPQNDVPLAFTTMRGLPSGENITLYVRVSSRLTTDIPGEFGFQLVGDVTSFVRERADVASQLQLFPNPVSDVATVRFHLEESKQLEARVIDVLGRSVLQRSLGAMGSGQQQFTIDTHNLPSGVYTLLLSDGKRQSKLKFVVN